MRSRTELVTTTFIDSEEDDTESDDSEEDWRPDSSNRNNGKKRKSKSRRTKRKSNLSSSKSSSSSSFSPFKRQKIETATFRDDLESDDGSYGGGTSNIYHQQHFSITTNPFSTKMNLIKDDKPLSQKVVAEQSMPDKSGIFQLYLYKKDLDKDYRTNSHLCLWRRDGSSLLQKYIRVKTNNSEEFIFTSSSVYSSWDERRRKDFAILAVKCLEENNRRVTILNISDLHALAEEVIRYKQLKTEKFEEESSNEVNEENSQGYDDDGEEEEEGYDDADNIGGGGDGNDDSNEEDGNGDGDEKDEDDNDEGGGHRGHDLDIDNSRSAKMSFEAGEDEDYDEVDSSSENNVNNDKTPNKP